MSNNETADSEEEILIYAEFEDSINISNYRSIHVLGINERNPIIQMDETFFTEPALTVISINIEGFSQDKALLLSEMCRETQCDSLCVQETHRDAGQTRPQIPGLKLIAEIPHPKHGSAVLAKPDIRVIRAVSCESIPRGCRTNYIPGLNTATAKLLNTYETQFADDPFSEETIQTGKYENSLGTYMFFEEDPTPPCLDPLFDRLPEKNLKYLYKTRKLLSMEDAYVTPKGVKGDGDVQNQQLQADDNIKPISFKTIQEGLEMIKKKIAEDSDSAANLLKPNSEENMPKDETVEPATEVMEQD